MNRRPAIISAQEISDGAAYVAPCPMCTFIGVMDRADEVRTPSVNRMRGGKVFVVVGPSSCGICGRLEVRGGSFEETAAAWTRHLAGFALRTDYLGHRKVLNTLRKLRAAGALPSAFPSLEDAPE